MAVYLDGMVPSDPPLRCNRCRVSRPFGPWLGLYTPRPCITFTSGTRGRGCACWDTTTGCVQAPGEFSVEQEIRRCGLSTVLATFFGAISFKHLCESHDGQLTACYEDVFVWCKPSVRLFTYEPVELRSLPRPVHKFGARPSGSDALSVVKPTGPS